MIQLVYLSRASQEVEKDFETHIQGILKTSRRNNREKDITGILIYRNGLFLQLLEAEQEHVMSLYEKITSDRRHRKVTSLFKQEATTRLFENWSMGFSQIDDSMMKVISRIVPWGDFAHYYDRDAGYQIPNHKILEFLKSFRYKEAA